MSKPQFVCVTCKEDFTREYGANRHNKLYHFERAQIVDYIEYIIGRAKGTIPPPTELPPRLIAIRKRKGKMLKNLLTHNETTSPFTIYPDLTSDSLNSHKNALSPDVAGSRPKKNDLLDETIAMFAEAVQLKNLQRLSGKDSIPPVYNPENNASFSSEIGDITHHFSDFHGQTSESCFLAGIISNAKKLAILRCLVEKLRCKGPTFHNFSLQPPHDLGPHLVGTLSSGESFMDQMSAPETIAQKPEDIFGFSGITCDHCLSFEFVAHCFNNRERNGLVIPTKHICKQASSDETNDRIYHVRQNMLISLDAATRTWTEDKTSVHALKLSTQADGQIGEILSIKHHSSPDKSVKIPLKSVNVIDLLIGRENHWVYRAVKEQQTPLQPYELEDFFLRTRTSTFAIFRVKMLYRSRQQPSFLGTFFVYLAKHYDLDAT